MLPYTQEAFFALFDVYNSAMWPGQWMAGLLGIAGLWMVLEPSALKARLTALIVAGFWLWTGTAFHLLYFTSLNFWAYGFAALFLIQGLVFLYAGGVKNRLQPERSDSRAKRIGLGLMLFGLIGYPVLGWFAGHVYPRAPTFGITPCPTVIYTLGYLLTLEKPRSWAIAAGPVIWAIIGSTSAYSLGVVEDLALLVALGLFIVARRA